MAPLPSERPDLTVVTIVFFAIMTLLSDPAIQIIHAGGIVAVESGAANGPLAAETVASISA